MRDPEFLSDLLESVPGIDKDSIQLDVSACWSRRTVCGDHVTVVIFPDSRRIFSTSSLGMMTKSATAMATRTKTRTDNRIEGLLKFAVVEIHS